MARLSAKKKQHLHQRANQSAALSNGGAAATAKATIGQANREYGRSTRDARGAMKVQNSQLNSMLANIASSGLKGKYAAQTAAGLRSAKIEASTGVPFGIADAARTRTDAITSAQADLASARASQVADAASNYDTLATAARKNKQSRMDSAVSDAKSAASAAKTASVGVKNALIVANNYLNAAKPKERDALLADRGAFAQGVAKDAEGADAVDAMKAIKILEKRQKKMLNSIPTFGW